MAKKNVSAIISAAGYLTAIFTTLVEELRKRGGTDEMLHSLSRPEGRAVIGQMADVMIKLLGPTYSVDVSCSTSDLVRRGNYGWSNADINDDHFPADVLHSADIILKHFGKNMSTEAVLKALDAEGLRPATMSELLALGAKHPRLQEEFPIVGLGSVWRDPCGDLDVGCFDCSDGRRKLYLNWIGHGWSDYCRFAAVRK